MEDEIQSVDLSFLLYYLLMAIITLDSTGYDALSSIREHHKDRKIVLTSGTFDLFHVGHLHYLQAVRDCGDIVVVMLSSDDRVRARKGTSRPIISEADRTEIVNSLAVVDYVFIDPSRQPPDTIDPVHALIIDHLQPDLYVTDGEDIRFSNVMDKSRQVIVQRETAGEHSSTTAIIAYIRNISL